MATEFQSLRLPAAQSRDRLTEFHVAETHGAQRLQHAHDLAFRGKKFAGLVDGHVENVGDRFAADLHFKKDAAITPPIAIGATQVNVTQKLHLDVFESVAAARGTASVARIETERSRCVAAFLREWLAREKFADLVERPDIAGRVAARGFA